MLSQSGSGSTAQKPQVTFPGRRKPIQKESETSSISSFKPRNHKNDKNAAEKYRDRATERRGGVNDYADVSSIISPNNHTNNDEFKVEKVMVDFEKANAEEDADLVSINSLNSWTR